MSPKCQEEKHEGDATLAYRIYSCLALKYSKELRAQRFQSCWRFEERLDIREHASCLLEKVYASCVTHFGHNTKGQFFFLKERLNGMMIVWDFNIAFVLLASL